MANTRLEYLFNLHLEKRATPEEVAELLALARQEGYHEQLNNLVDEALGKQYPGPGLDAQTADDILMSITQAGNTRRVVRRPGIWRYAAAAAVILCIITGGYLLYRQPAKAPSSSIVSLPAIRQDVPPGGSRALLTLADGSVITLDSAQNGVLAQQGGATIRKQQPGQLVYDTRQPAGAGQPAINLLTTPRGGTYQLTLPDGSKVWLNAASSLRFPAMFTGKERKVELTGEAYFEIAPHPEHPFLVQANALTIQVLGTSFNVNAYTDEEAVSTTLLEGAVRVGKGAAGITVKPGEQARWQPGADRFAITHPNTEQVLAWKNGFFRFNGDNITTIMKQLARWYDIEPVYIGDMKMKDYSAYISRNSNISEVLNMLQLTEEINCKVEGKKVIITAR